MATATLTRSAWGLDYDRAENWTTRAACLDDMRFTEGPFGNQLDSFRPARQLIHVCVAHCPVVKPCYREARANPPMGAVQGGRMWSDWRKELRVADSGCGQWCAHLPAVHKAGAR